MKHAFLYTSFFLLSVVFLFVSCKKESKRFCWQIVDALGNDMMTVCNRTEEELIACFKNGTCANVSGFSECNYYKIEQEKFCWLWKGFFMKDESESRMNYLQKCFGGTLTKVDCGYCAHWFTREKRTYKPAGNTVYSHVIRQSFCGDTVRTLFNGREIIRKNDADSLIVIQFSNNGNF
jgi:hypothetical protein